MRHMHKLGNLSKGGLPMLQIHIESIKNPKVYRKFQVNTKQTLFDLEYVISSGFDFPQIMDSNYEAKRQNGQAVKQMIYSFPDDEQSLDTDEELIEEWLVQPGDELLFITGQQKYDLKIQLEQIVDESLEFDSCIGGEGHLDSNKKKIDLDEINLKLSLKEALDNVDLNDIDNILSPDYLTLLELSNELNKMKPWKYFENEEIIALELVEVDEVFFVSVMGAAGQEFGLMVYDEELGYTSLASILSGRKLSDDFHFDLSALTINFVDRAALEKDDYQLIKDCGLSFRGKNNWIQFRSYEPGAFPTIPLFSNVEIMISIVRAMIQVTQLRMKGWRYPVVTEHVYPAFKVPENGLIADVYLLEIDLDPKGMIEIEINDLEKAQIKRKPKVPLQIEYDLFYLPYPVGAEDEERLIYPVMCMVMDRMTGEVLNNDMMPFPKLPFIQQQMFWKLMVEIPVRPSKIYVKKETKEVLQQLAKLIGIELVVSELPNISEFKGLMESMPPLD